MITQTATQTVLAIQDIGQDTLITVDDIEGTYLVPQDTPGLEQVEVGAMVYFIVDSTLGPLEQVVQVVKQ